jgi:hypothetical protein
MHNNLITDRQGRTSVWLAWLVIPSGCSDPDPIPAPETRFHKIELSKSPHPAIKPPPILSLASSKLRFVYLLSQ